MAHLHQTHHTRTLMTPAIIFSATLFNLSNRASYLYVEGWSPRRGGQCMGNINGQPNRIPSSSSLLMKKRDKKQRKEGNTSHTYNDIDGIGQIASEENFRYHISDGFVARLEAIYGKDIMQDSFLDDKKRTKIVAEDWSELAEGPCLGDCCGDECDEQCDIPEDYKRFARKNEKVDVMAFLGIKRVDPLRVQREWE